MSRRLMTPKDLWALPRVGAPAPSPDADRLIVPVTTYSIEDNVGRTRLWLVPAGGARGRERPLTSDEVSSSQPTWSPDGSAVLYVRKPGGRKRKKKRGGPKYPDQPQLYRLSLDGGEPERLTDLPHGVTDPKCLSDGRRVAFLATVEKGESDEGPKATESRFFRMWDQWLTDGKLQHLFLLDLKTGETVDAIPSLESWIHPIDPAGSYDLAPDGSEATFAGCRSKPPHSPLLWGIYTVKLPARVREGARTFKPRLISPRSLPDASMPRYSPNGRWILHGILRERGNWSDRSRLAVFDRKRGEHTVLTEAWTLAPQEWAWSARGDSVYCTADVAGRGGLFTLPFNNRSAQRSAGVPRELVRGGTISSPRLTAERVFVSTSSIGAPPEVESFDLGGKRRRKLTTFTASRLGKLELARAESVTFGGADGAKVQMWVLWPPEKKSKGKKRRRTRKPPLLHLIHGGPHGSFGDVWHWRWNSQVFAARGYAVAMVNFHGSTGWGQEFASSIVGEWGDKPYRDVMAATDHLVDAGRVSAKRLAAAGGSYGGYLSSWIASQTDRFRCIVNHAGVCDLQAQMGCDIPQGWPLSAGGDVWSDQEGLDRYNPIRHAAGFKSPMLVLHGEQDYRVPYYQALQIYNVYKARGLEARLVCYPDENHWILKPQNNLHWYGEFLGWLKRWL